jgi:hypothetical protein
MNCRATKAKPDPARDDVRVAGLGFCIANLLLNADMNAVLCGTIVASPVVIGGRRLQPRLASYDERLARAAVALGIELLEPD